MVCPMGEVDEVMNEELVGQTVRLRPVVAADRERVVEMRQTPEVARWWRGVDLGADFDESLAEGLMQFVIEAPDGAVVGLVQVSEEPDPEYRHASLDILVDPAHHRQGYGTDALRTVIAYLATQGHHRVTIDPSVDNAAAIACYRRVGFEPVGVMRAYERQSDGTWNDGLLMDLII